MLTADGRVLLEAGEPAYLRLFVALQLPTALAEEIGAECLPPLQAVLPDAKWTAPAHLHLTLYFLGDERLAHVPALAAALDAAAAAHPPFALSLHEVGAFPSLRRPRVLWLGAHAAGEALPRLAGAVKDACDGQRPPLRPRPFHPHVTLGRVRDAAAAARLAAPLARAAARLTTRRMLPAREIQLVRSELTRRGPRYTVLARHPLGGAAAYRVPASP